MSAKLGMACSRVDRGRHSPAATVITSPALAAGRLLSFCALTLAALPVQAILLALRRPMAATLPRWYHGKCLRLLGVRVAVSGTPSRAAPTLFVSNHSAYLDIIVHGALIEGSFVAKSEVRDWPLIGLLARLQRSVFVVRRASAVRDHMQNMRDRLESGDRLVLFAEGTSSDGNRVLRFNSSLFSAAEPDVAGKPVTVQPVAISYTRLDGMPLGRHLRPLVAWYGAMELVDHLWRMAGLGRTAALVQFLQPVTIAAFADRKELSAYCERQVAAAHAAALCARVGPRGADGRGWLDTISATP